MFAFLYFSLESSIEFGQSDIGQDEAFTGIHGLAHLAGDDDDFLGRIMKVLVEIFIQSPDSFGPDTDPGGVGGIRAERDINPRLMALIRLTGLKDPAGGIAFQAEHQGHHIGEEDFLAAGIATEVEPGRLGTSQMTPKMIPFPIILDGGDGFLGKSGNPAAAVKTALRHQISAAEADHAPAVTAGGPGHEFRLRLLRGRPLVERQRVATIVSLFSNEWRYERNGLYLSFLRNGCQPPGRGSASSPSPAVRRRKNDRDLSVNRL